MAGVDTIRYGTSHICQPVQMMMMNHPEKGVLHAGARGLTGAVLPSTTGLQLLKAEAEKLKVAERFWQLLVQASMHLAVFTLLQGQDACSNACPAGSRGTQCCWTED